MISLLFARKPFKVSDFRRFNLGLSFYFLKLENGLIGILLKSHRNILKNKISVPFYFVKVYKKKNSPGNNIRKSGILCDGQQKIYFYGIEAFKNDSEIEGVKKFKR